MISNTSLYTCDSSNFEITQFYYSPQIILPPDNKNLSSLYGFISFQQPWNEVVLTTNAAPTIVIHDCAIISNTNNLIIANAETLNDFFIGQEVIDDSLPTNTFVSLIDEDNFQLILSKSANSTKVGKFTFKGFTGNDNKLTVYDNGLVSDIDDEYKGCAVTVDVVNQPGELVYYRSVVSYDADTKTFIVDEPFNDSPPISSSSTVRLSYDNAHPPKPKDSIKYKKEVFKNMFYLKKITSNNISPVIRRINWVSGQVYDYYRDDINLYEKEVDGTPKYKFYIVNQFNQVFKCVWNNSGGPSTVEPYFVAGNFDDITNIFYDPEDGYKWKYMYTISYNKFQIFMDENWIPLNISEPPDVKDSIEKIGGIESINVINGGQGYDASNAVVNIIVTGDGIGAEAYAEIDTETKTIENIVIKSPGYNYTSANVIISSTQGNNAIAVASVSPIGGHGTDVMSELGCENLMVTFMTSGSEDNKLPIDLQIRQIGLLHSPVANSTYPYVANSESYSISTDMIVSNGFGTFVDGEIIYQTPNNANIANATFSATCVNFESAPNKLRLINLNGNPVTGSSIYGGTSGTARTLLQTFNPDLIKYTGRIIHIENREEIQRSSDGMELFRLVLKF